MKKRVIDFFLVFLIIPLVSAVEVVQVQTPSSDVNIFNPFKYLNSKLVVGAIIIFVGIIAFFILCFFVVRWLVNFIKLRSDIFFKLKAERIKMAKIQRRYPSKAWFKIEKNTPMRIVKKDEKGILQISKPFAYHRGDYTTHEGNIIISMNLIGDKSFYVLPKTSILIIPNKKSIKLNQRGKKDKAEAVLIENLPNPKDIIRFNENEILFFIENISNTGMFYIPVLKTEKGEILDLSMPVYQSLKNVVIADYLYEQTDEFGKITKKSMDLNPNLRYQQKASDSSNSVETGTQESR